MWQRPVVAFLAFAAAVVTVAIETVIPLFTRDAVDVATGQRTDAIATELLPNLRPITAIIVLLLACAAIRFFFQGGRRLAAGFLAHDTQHRMRVSVLDTLQQLDGRKQDSIRTGQVVSRTISDLTMVQALLAMFPMAFGNVAKLIFTLIVMVFISPLLTVIALISVPVLVWITMHSRSAVFAATWSAQQKAADLAEHVEETVTGVRVVKAFAGEERETDELERRGKALYAHRMRNAAVSARYMPALEQVPQIALVLNVVLGGFMAMTGSITIGTFVAFTAYLSALTMLTRSLANMVLRLSMGLASIDRIYEVIDLAPEMSEPEDPAAIPEGSLGIRATDVEFSNPDNDVLNGFTLDVRPGEKVALVGPPGAGKTMFVQLASKFYEPKSGSIALTTPISGHENPRNDDPHGDGTLLSSVSYENIHSHALRKRLTTVFDDPFLFSTTVRQNIAMGGDYSDEEIEAAARAAQAHDFIMKLDDGYDEVVGERGLTLSGGQRQRIALARALLSRPSILLLDDATSAIDATTEEEIYSALDAMGSVTIIAVAHRTSTIQLADRVALVEDGRVTAIGTPDEMALNPRYARLMDQGFTEEPESEDDPLCVDCDDDTMPTMEELWPETSETSAEQDGNLDPRSRRQGTSSPGMNAMRRGGGMRMGPSGGMAALAPPSKKLLADVTALPPAKEEPKVDSAAARAEQNGFRLAPLFASARGLIIAVIFLLLVSVAADLVFPHLVRVAIDDGIVGNNATKLYAVAGVGLVIIAVAWVAGYLRQIFTARTGERLLYTLRLRSYAHLQRLSMDFFERTLSGKIMTRMTTDIDALSSFLQTGVAQGIVALATLFGIIGMLVATDPSLSLLMLAVIPIIVIATLIFRSISSRLYGIARNQISEVNAEFQESINGLRTAQVHRMEDYTLDSFTAASRQYRQTRIKAQFAVATYFPGIGFIYEATQAAVLYFGAEAVLSGRLTAGVLVAFLMYMGLLFGPIQELSMLFDGYQQAKVSFGRIRELLTTKPTVRDTGTRSEAEVTEAAQGAIELHDVDFGYSGTSQLVAEDLSVRIEPGTTVAVVGTTGAGKSTLVKLLVRFYDPVSGTVTAGGTDIQELPIRVWRRHIGFVPQEAHLFSGTIAENIAYGKPDASREEITDTARRVGALTAIASIPGGFTHQIGERGLGLSSGQRQLIALARAEMLQPQIMLLDEATATLDPATEASFLEASDRVTKGRTSIVVAHRLATAEHADRILVVEDGAIIEDGTHEELLQQGGHYAQMWKSQTHVSA
ncbi:MAG: ABC transporter ATP-binding protein/permease [Corynebacterium glucuronolyticum]|nr:ABC transporter ATP-binding protein/permease [Corynebacterium glucuronolyticum]